MKGLLDRVDFPRETRIRLKVRACSRLRDRREIVKIGEERDREPSKVHLKVVWKVVTEELRQEKVRRERRDERLSERREGVDLRKMER